MNFINKSQKVFSKLEIKELPKYSGILSEQIFIVDNSTKLNTAFEDLCNYSVIGFDTESKPVFKRGQKSKGPHIIQFSTSKIAYLIQVDFISNHRQILDILHSKKIIKVGFNLKDDITFIKSKLKVNLQGYIDLQCYFKLLGSKNSVGLKQAVARVFGKQIQKSKNVTTTNWSFKKLSDAQKKYAADDAFAALQVYNKILENDKKRLLSCIK